MKEILKQFDEWLEKRSWFGWRKGILLMLALLIGIAINLTIIIFIL